MRGGKRGEKIAPPGLIGLRLSLSWIRRSSPVGKHEKDGFGAENAINGKGWIGDEKSDDEQTG